jgi:hypothetical protein
MIQFGVIRGMKFFSFSEHFSPIFGRAQPRNLKVPSQSTDHVVARLPEVVPFVRYERNHTDICKKRALHGADQ